ncbi:hypothetical protein D9M69_730180 [compost metagenome]
MSEDGPNAFEDRKLGGACILFAASECHPQLAEEAETFGVDDCFETVDFGLECGREVCDRLVGDVDLNSEGVAELLEGFADDGFSLFAHCG